MTRGSQWSSIVARSSYFSTVMWFFLSSLFRFRENRLFLDPSKGGLPPWPPDLVAVCGSLKFWLLMVLADMWLLGYKPVVAVICNIWFRAVAKKLSLLSSWRWWQFWWVQVKFGSVCRSDALVCLQYVSFVVLVHLKWRWLQPRHHRCCSIYRGLYLLILF